jgi:hypothetical protein
MLWIVAELSRELRAHVCGEFDSGRRAVPHVFAALLAYELLLLRPVVSVGYTPAVSPRRVSRHEANQDSQKVAPDAFAQGGSGCVVHPAWLAAPTSQ